MKALMWVSGVVAAAAVLLVFVPSPEQAEAWHAERMRAEYVRDKARAEQIMRDDDAAKQACVKAMMSNIGTSTTGYSDKQAYDSHVAEKCAGLTINGKPLGIR